jgi:hypothetical protein
MPAQFHAAANIRGGRGKTKTKEKIGANKTLHYGSGARKKKCLELWNRNSKDVVT